MKWLEEKWEREGEIQLKKGRLFSREAEKETHSICSVECGTYYDVNIKQWECIKYIPVINRSNSTKS